MEEKQCEGVSECDVDCAGYFTNVQPACSRGGGKCTTEAGCSKKCGGGVSKKKWHLTKMGSGKGEPCTFQDGEVVTSECNTHPCPVPCQGGWVLLPDAECSEPCGGGTVTMTYDVRREAAHGRGHRGAAPQLWQMNEERRNT